jgi:hypothetical protein
VPAVWIGDPSRLRGPWTDDHPLVQAARARDAQSYEIISFEYAQMAANRPSKGQLARCGAIFVLDEHNIEYDIVGRTASSARSLDRKLYSLVDSRKLRREERQSWQRFDGDTVTSTRHEELLRRDMPTATTAVVPNAVDVDFAEMQLEDQPEGFAMQVGRLLDDAGLRHRIGSAARARIERSCSWDSSVARLEDFYAALFARRAAAV